MIARIKEIQEAGIFAELLDYGGFEGMVLTSEYSKRRMLDASQHFKVGGKEVVKVLQLNRATRHMDLSKKKVSREEKERCKQMYKKTQVLLLNSSFQRHVNAMVTPC